MAKEDSERLAKEEQESNSSIRNSTRNGTALPPQDDVMGYQPSKRRKRYPLRGVGAPVSSEHHDDEEDEEGEILDIDDGEVTSKLTGRANTNENDAGSEGNVGNEGNRVIITRKCTPIARGDPGPASAKRYSGSNGQLVGSDISQRRGRRDGAARRRRKRPRVDDDAGRYAHALSGFE